MIARLDNTIVYAWLLLMTIGLIFVASASAQHDLWSDVYLERQCIYVLAGVAVFIVASFIPTSFVFRMYWLAIFAAIGISAAVLVPSIGTEINGSRRWIDLGFFTVQVSEWVRPLVVVFLSGLLAHVSSEAIGQRVAIVIALVCVGPVIALVYLEPDFGTAVILAAVTLGFLFIARTPISQLLVLGLGGVGALAFLLIQQPYRAERIVTFLDPWSAPLDGGYQLTQALMAFGRGEISGVGLGDGVQKLLYLPEAHNDFIYAVIAEESGLIGALVVLAILAFVVVRAFEVGRAAVLKENLFGGYLCYGVGMVLASQALINIGVNVGALPTKGLTLPFVSYGGNSLLVCCAMLALVYRTELETENMRDESS